MACACAGGVAGWACGVAAGVAGGVSAACGFAGFGANPWASVACLCTGFEGWLFGGLTLLGPPAISLSKAFFVP